MIKSGLRPTAQLRIATVLLRKTDRRDAPFAECGKYTAEGEKILFENKNASPNEAMIMCIVDGKVVGNCEISFFKGIKTRHRATVAIALISEYWNQGIGTRMFQEMIRLAKEREGITQIELEFVEGNDRARHLYEKMGFRITGYRPNAIRLYQANNSPAQKSIAT